MKIKFTPFSEIAQNILPTPLPATKFIPKWYSKMNLFMNSEKTYGLSDSLAPNTTMKACTPFLDALTIGYIWYLPTDLQIKKNFQGYDFYFTWRTEGNFITHHSEDQHPTLPPSINGTSFVSKFQFDFLINTPKGYSTFFTHPINRHDLPFRTFSGIVDTDTYNLPIQFPFQLLNFDEDSIIIEKNTPVCQFFPFARKNWNSEIEKYDEIKHRKKMFYFKSFIKRSYKNNFWHPKEFK
jgi:hypothetical protein